MSAVTKKGSHKCIRSIHIIQSTIHDGDRQTYGRTGRQMYSIASEWLTVIIITTILTLILITACQTVLVVKSKNMPVMCIQGWRVPARLQEVRHPPQRVYWLPVSGAIGNCDRKSVGWCCVISAPDGWRRRESAATGQAEHLPGRSTSTVLRCSHRVWVAGSGSWVWTRAVCQDFGLRTQYQRHSWDLRLDDDAASWEGISECHKGWPQKPLRIDVPRARRRATPALHSERVSIMIYR